MVTHGCPKKAIRASFIAKFRPRLILRAAHKAKRSSSPFPIDRPAPGYQNTFNQTPVQKVKWWCALDQRNNFARVRNSPCLSVEKPATQTVSGHSADRPKACHARFNQRYSPIHCVLNSVVLANTTRHAEAHSPSAWASVPNARGQMLNTCNCTNLCYASLVRRPRPHQSAWITGHEARLHLERTFRELRWLCLSLQGSSRPLETFSFRELLDSRLTAKTPTSEQIR